MSTVVRHIQGFESSLTRALCWAAAWDMVRDAELSGRDYVALALAGLPIEEDINLITATQRQVQSVLTFYVDPGWAPTGWQQLADASLTASLDAAPGSGFQLAWARCYVSSARSEADLARTRGWLTGDDVPAGLTIDTELRWGILQALVAAGAAGPDEIEAELDDDRTASGERQAALARAMVNTPESKAETWRRLVADHALPNWLQRAMLQGFQHPWQVELTAPYAPQFFDRVDEAWANRDGEQAQEFAILGYPAFQIDEATVEATDEWLAAGGHTGPLRRLVMEGRDGVVRALRARARDRAA